MARKVFVSYKHGDSLVAPLGPRGTCRDYVDRLMEQLEDVEIYKGEEPDNDLSTFKEEAIRTQLKDKIRDSSVTVVLVSKGMKEYGKPEADQWIPWEISYSLRKITTGERSSNRNGMLAVIVPDEQASYGHYYQPNPCIHCNTTTHKTNDLFQIMDKNMFNRLKPTQQTCPADDHGTTYHLGDDHSYIYPVRWGDFILYPSLYIDMAVAIRERVDEYDISISP